jgi:hypothetical protein
MSPSPKIQNLMERLRNFCGGGGKLEAAIGIEPMNKGFAVLAELFAQVQASCRVSVFVSVFGISSLRMIT